MNAILEKKILEKLHLLDDENLGQVLEFVEKINKSVTVRQCKGMLANRTKVVPQDNFSQAILRDDQASRS